MLWKREPALFLGAVQAVVALAVAFGLHLSTVQTGSILAVTAAILALITRSQVTPTAALPPAETEVPTTDEF
ncbi:hypothetical protein AB0P21_09810 [Kribbella sp. NPDC056861]|uniref:hypothetical protein n=1 Tax=Kribbella sp. NPDC056861 TaxID=3154857 RepID=UPI00342B10D5